MVQTKIFPEIADWLYETEVQNHKVDIDIGMEEVFDEQRMGKKVVSESRVIDWQTIPQRIRQ